MITPAVVTAIVFPLALLSDSFRGHFAAPLTFELQVTFFASVVVMALHKIESYWSLEYDQCPVYVSQAVDNPRRAIFLAFVPPFVAMMFMVFLAFIGPPFHLLSLAVWLGQGVHELHHTAKSLARRRLYPGLFTSVVFVGLMSLGMFPLWHDAVIGERGLFFVGYYAVQPVMFLAFYFEDRRWIARAPESIWNPEAPGPVGAGVTQ